MAEPGDDDPFAPATPSPVAATPPPPEPPPVPIYDAREAGRAVAAVLMATGSPTGEEVQRANQGLARLGRPPLSARDLVATTPEQVAPLVPIPLRTPLAELLGELAGDEPIRCRIAASYVGLWQLVTPPPVAGELLVERPGPFLRWLIGNLPRHQKVEMPAPEETRMEGAYRGPDAPAAPVAPVERNPLRLRVERIREEYLQVVAAVEKVIIGKRDVVERVLTAMAARGHVLLVDVPGVGKTQLCKAIAASIEAQFGRVQFTPDLLPMDITGGSIYDVREKRFTFRAGPIFTHILLADEINRATPKTQSALLEVMEERAVTVDGVTHKLAEPFQVLATMNPLDHEGTYALPAAQIDRFMVMLELGYPSPEDEVRVLDAHLAPEPPLSTLTPVISRAAFCDWQATVPLIHVTPEVKRAAVEYVNGLRRDSDENHAVSPRATLAWVRAAQARAMLTGREFVTIEDLLDMAPDVLRHRLWTSGAAVRERLRAVGLKVTATGGAR